MLRILGLATACGCASGVAVARDAGTDLALGIGGTVFVAVGLLGILLVPPVDQGGRDG